MASEEYMTNEAQANQEQIRKEEEAIQAALEAGIAISTAYGQTPDKLMPISDKATLLNFAFRVAERARDRALEEAAKVIDDSQIYHREDGYEWIECLKNPKELAKSIRTLASDEGTKGTGALKRSEE